MYSSFDKPRLNLLSIAAILLGSVLMGHDAEHATAQNLSNPILPANVLFNEADGIVAVEAEHFFRQDRKNVRAFFITTPQNSPRINPDGDPPHVADASNGAYIEVLPDTRRTHGDKIQPGVNFSNNPGEAAVVSYRVNIQTPGRYYVWVRAYSTGSEDNGIHVGINGTWPESGKRMQWCKGKQRWWWESKQRTEAVHCGVDHQIYLDIPRPGAHMVHFSMREDGFEFDKFLLTRDRNFQQPKDSGPVSTSNSDDLPTFVATAGDGDEQPETKPKKKSKAKEDQKQKQNKNKKEDRKNKNKDKNKKDQTSDFSPTDSDNAIVLTPKQFDIQGTNYYLDQKKWMGINPNQHKTASVDKTLQLPPGNYSITLQTVGENDGSSLFEVAIDGSQLGTFKSPLSTDMFETGGKYDVQWNNVSIKSDSVITVGSTIASADGREYSRARWQAVVLQPADEETQLAVAKTMQDKATGKSKPNKNAKPKPSQKAAANRDRSTSPTQSVSDALLTQPRQSDGDGTVAIAGELKQWHKITLSMNGPFAHEHDNVPNPFLDYRMQTLFTHTDGTSYSVPGYFAADGNASETSAKSGTTWRTNFAPDRTGQWQYVATIVKGDHAAIDDSASVEKLYETSGQLNVAVSDKPADDFRSHGRLQYIGQRYLQHAGSKKFFLKCGADSPETLLAYVDFDDTIALKKKVPLKTFSKHRQDWKPGDPVWKNGKGKGLIGAINYLSGKGCNAFSFLTYNAGGDGDNVWPFVQRDDKLHYDCSKLDQWQIVLDHGTGQGMYLHFKLQETENDDHRRGHQRKELWFPTSLDGGNLGVQRKLYLREIIARFGHNLALNWNLGEENTQSKEQQIDMIDYISQTDPYGHNIVLHTYPNLQDDIYNQLIGDQSKLTGLSLQNSNIKDTHQQTVKWVRASADSGRPWVVAFDESGSAPHGQCPDLGYQGFDGKDTDGKYAYDQHTVRRQTLWANIMGGGAGLEYYFGYKFAENDLLCEDWRSRDQSWDYGRICLEFFDSKSIPFYQMTPSDELIGNTKFNNDKYCLANPGEIYLVYLPQAGATELDLSAATGDFGVTWFNPETGQDIAAQGDATTTLAGGGSVTLNSGMTNGQDVVAIVRRK